MTRDIPASRAGVTLVELMVAMMLMMVLAAIGGVAARRTLSTQAQLFRTDTRATTLSDALRTLTRHASKADPSLGDLRRARDTVLEFVHAIGITSICRIKGDTLTIGSSHDSLPWSSVSPRAVTTDDAVRVWLEDPPHWETRAIAAIGTASGACGDSAVVWPDRAAQRVTLASTIAGARVGAPIRILQREKWSLVRGGDGTWALSLATWDASANVFTIPQPLASPLASPSAPDGPGLAARAIDPTGAILTDSALRVARSLIVTLRTPRHPRDGVLNDSVRINVGHE